MAGRSGIPALLAALLSALVADPVAAGSAPGIGVQFRISEMGGTGDEDFHGISAAVAYNSQAHEYLVVWSGDDNVGGLINGELEIFAQRLDAATGAPLGIDDFRISDMGGTGDASFLGVDPAVVYNSQANQYLVVWTGEDDVGGLADGELEIFGQLLDAAGVEIGANDFRISDLGPDGSATYRASAPAVAYNSQDDQYLVVWHGDDDSGGQIDQELEIFGQRLDATGALVGANDFRISDAGGIGNAVYAARNPAVAYDAQDNQYLIVWEGDDDVGGRIDDEFEISGQRLDAAGAAIGTNDFRISDMGGTGDESYLAFRPALAWNSQGGEFLVVWHGDDDVDGLINDEVEVFGQRLDAAGAEVGSNDFRISATGPDENLSYLAVMAAVAYDGQSNEYLVVWHGSDDAGGLVIGEFEVFGQILTAAGDPIGVDDFRISVMAGSGNAMYLGRNATVAHNGTDDEYLVAWEAEDNAGGMVNEEFEIFGERLLPPLFFDGFETGDTSAWLP